MAVTQFHLLKTRRFLPLFIAQFLGAFNDNVFKNALVMMITYQMTEGTSQYAQMLVTMAAGIFILPYFLFSATAGQMADKFEKTRLIRTIKLAEILLMVLAAAGFYLHNIPILMTVLFLIGAQATFFGPVKYAILPAQLHDNELIAGNAFIEAGTFFSILLGTITGGLLIFSSAGEQWIATAIICLSIAGFISSLYIPLTHSSDPQLIINYRFLNESFRVVRYTKDRWDIFLSILGISWFWLVGAVFLAEFPVFAKDILHADQHVVTWFIAIFSVGIAIGSLLCNQLLKGKVHATYVPFGALGMTLFVIDLYFASRYANGLNVPHLMGMGTFLSSFNGWRISFDLLGMAVCGGIYTVPLYAILQQRSEESHRARVMASNNIVNALFMVFAAVGTMLMLKLNFTVIDVFLVIAILNMAVAIYICQLLPDLVVKAILRLLFRTIYRTKVHGMEHYHQSSERLIIIANHTSFLDAALLAAFIPDKLTFAVDTQTSKKAWVKFFLHLVEAFPMDPTNPMAIKSLVDYVKEGKKCVIFPEGRITVTGALMKIFEGPGLIADKANANILPICIQGAQFSPFSRLKGKMPIRFAPAITLSIFPARSMDISADIKGRERRQRISLALYDIMTTIVFESCHYRQTLFTSLIEAQSIHGRRYPILSDIDYSPLNYHQLILRSFLLGSVLKRRTHSQEAVGILLPNMVSTAVVFFALQAYGRVPAMLNFTTGVKNILLACQTAEIRLVCTSKRFIENAKLAYLIDDLVAAGKKVLYLEEVREQIGWSAKCKAKIMAYFPTLTYRKINRGNTVSHAEHAAVILFTSGSEGTPKGVVLSHKNIQANRYQLSSCIDFTELDKVFNTLPLFHSFGLTGGLILPVLSGIQVFLYPSPLHYRIVPELIYGLNATILFGTDTFLAGYAAHAHPYDFYSLRYVFSGAEKLRVSTMQVWSRKFGVRIFDGYGATETSPVLSTNTPMQYREGTVGRLLPGIQYQITPVPGIEKGGKLLVSGPNIMKGYLLADQPGEIASPPAGWYDTGDVVSIDEEGFLTIQGRIKRFAKIGGEMVSLTMVEQFVQACWPAYQHAVINWPDRNKGEQLILVTNYSQAKLKDLVVYAKANQIGEINVPKKIMTIDSMPILGSGKIDYPGLKAWLEEKGA